MTEQEELELGRQAREVLENPAFQGAIARLQQEIQTKWQGERDKDGREWLWALMQASKRLESVLIETMGSGQLRAKQIELQRTRLERAGKTLRRAFGG
jgi:hypothetical protein